MKGSYKGKRVLVTGADGFMGSHLTERLVNEGAKVSIYIRGNSITGTVLYTLKNLAPFEKTFEEIITGNPCWRIREASRSGDNIPKFTGLEINPFI